MVAIGSWLATPPDVRTSAVLTGHHRHEEAPASPIDVFAQYCPADPHQAVPAKALSVLRKRARPFIECAVNAAYQYFPVKRPPLIQRILQEVLTPETLCRALVPTEPEPTDLDAAREKIRGSMVTPEGALPKGLVVKRLPVKKKCPAGYDWENPQHYNDVDDCQDVKDVMGDEQLPVVTYAVRATEETVRATLGDPHHTSRYSRFDDEEMRQCQTDDGKPAVFLDLWAGTIGTVDFDVELVFEPLNTVGCGAWNLRPSCLTDDGTRIEADDLMYSFGGRVYLPLTVTFSEGSDPEGRTLIMSSVAATSSTDFVRSVASGKALPRFVAGELCRKLDLDQTAGR